MVYAFLLQNNAPKEELSTLIYSEVFGTGLNIDTPPDDQRKLRKDQLQQIAIRVNSEFRFKKACSIEFQENATSNDRLAHAMYAGVFRLPLGKPLPVEKHVIWQAIDGCCISMILSPAENKALAENILNLIVRYLLQTFKVFDQCDEMIANPEKIAAILQVFLPNGQLVFMNRRVVKQLEKELFRILSEDK